VTAAHGGARGVSGPVGVGSTGIVQVG